VKELETMVATKEKAEIQALSSFDFQYLTKVFLPQKIEAGDWIRNDTLLIQVSLS
jgi:meiotic recombination protein SPO11